jgi:hypothetical protein
MEGLFSLKEGGVITVPVDAVRQDSKSQRFSPQTPKVLRLREVKRKKGNLFEIKSFEDDARLREAADYRGKVLFAPANIQPGDELRIEWVDLTCACAVFAS